MSFIRDGRLLNAKLLHSIKEIGENESDDVMQSPLLPQVVDLPSPALSPMSSTLASMSSVENMTLNADVRKSALGDEVPSSPLLVLTGHSIRPDQTKSSQHKDSIERSRNCDIDFKNRQRRTPPQCIQPSKNTLRRGKWTSEEEEYANAVVREFNSGYLDAPAGTTLRIYLSEKLQCDPMRITKKFTGNDSIGKRVFHPTGRNGDGLSKEAKEAQAIIEDLYRKWKERIEYQDRESARKAMAAAAVSEASSLSEGIIQMKNIPVISSSGFNYIVDPHQRVAQNAVHKAAHWLYRAEVVLSKTGTRVGNADGAISPARQIHDCTNVENDLDMISRLVEEAPVILSAVADLPRQIEGHNRQPQRQITPSLGQKRKHCTDFADVLDCRSNPMKLLASISSHAAPVPILQEDSPSKKQPRARPTVTSDSISEDAKTFVNFLQSMG
ncbi:hypothetical protein HJC23_006914 [Cyclotella cryptica]|uniref:Uncharacterized protein n=1 Tax=Cyclotella cryptica TaxID=29204 RepID=A0ABD3QDF4_9STRA|eukprot:CCRYP_006770-RA/>CCRYP_006770-RA protein AED:0.11 eAED:0.11 QI:259/1/1/1/1/1/2/1676/440